MLSWSTFATWGVDCLLKLVSSEEHPDTLRGGKFSSFDVVFISVEERLSEVSTLIVSSFQATVFANRGDAKDMLLTALVGKTMWTPSTADCREKEIALSRCLVVCCVVLLCCSL